MIIVHIITFVVYLLSLSITYMYYYQWNDESLESENKVFISYSVSCILLFFIQLVLIYIFYGLGKSPLVVSDVALENEDV